MTPGTESPVKNSAIIPVAKLEADFYDWQARHDAKVREAAARNHDLVFIGDSLTHLFEGHPGMPDRGDRVWAEYYGKRNALNLGYGWDRTQNVLWRLSNGEFAGQTPRLVVLLIGTNNLTGSANAATNSPAEIVAGIWTICRLITAASPRSRILLMGVFPRSTPADPLRTRVLEINAILKAEAGRYPAVTHLDIGERFLAADGSIPVTIMSDGVHLVEASYRIWAEAIEPFVAGTSR